MSGVRSAEKVRESLSEEWRVSKLIWIPAFAIARVATIELAARARHQPGLVVGQLGGHGGVSSHACDAWVGLAYRGRAGGHSSV